MKRRFLTICLSVAITGSVFAQATNRTSAIMAYQSAQKEMMQGKAEDAAASMDEALKYMDLAYEHETTQNDPKTMYYAYQIYSSYVESKAMSGGSQEEVMALAMQYGPKIQEAVKRLYQYDTKKKYVKDFERQLEGKRGQMFNMGVEAFQAEKYMDAFQMFSAAAKVYESVSKVDSVSYLYAGHSALNIKDFDNAYLNYNKCIEINYEKEKSYQNAIACLTELGKTEEAKALNEKAYNDFPDNMIFITPILNDLLKEEKYVESEALLQKAIASEPNNVNLLFNAAAVYYNLANETYVKANETSDNSEYEKLKAEYIELYGKTVPYLEKGHELAPEDLDFINYLMQVYMKLGGAENQQKALEMKRKKDAVEAKQ